MTADDTRRCLSSDRIAAISAALKVAPEHLVGADASNVEPISPTVLLRQSLDLVAAFREIENVGTRTRVIEMVRALAAAEPPPK